MLFIYSLFPPLPDTVPAVQLNKNCSLPCRLGGLGIINPTTIADSQFSASNKITSLHKDLIIQQSVIAKLHDVSSIN